MKATEAGFIISSSCRLRKIMEIEINSEADKKMRITIFLNHVK